MAGDVTVGAIYNEFGFGDWLAIVVIRIRVVIATITFSTWTIVIIIVTSASAYRYIIIAFLVTWRTTISIFSSFFASTAITHNDSPP